MSKTHRSLTRDEVRKAHERIKPYIHQTPVLTCVTLSDLASSPQSKDALVGTIYEGQAPARPRINLFFKCENYQKIGAFKARGAYNALSQLTDGELEKGVVTHSSGNHAQALALAAQTRGVTAHIVMPTISTPSKIASTRALGAHVVHSGSTAPEREAVVTRIQQETGAILVPPYDHPDIILGQGTVALEFEQQVKNMIQEQSATDAAHEGWGWRARTKADVQASTRRSDGLDAMMTPVGGGGLLSGVSTAMYGTGIHVFGSEPSYQGCDDCRRGLLSSPPERIEKVSSLTIADGLRTPVGVIPFTIISDKAKVRGVYSVSEQQIKAAWRLLLERAKLFVEPSSAVPVAVCLFDEEFRRLVEKEAGPEGWNVGIVLSGGNTTVEAISAIFGNDSTSQETEQAQRAEAKLGLNGDKTVENIAG